MPTSKVPKRTFRYALILAIIIMCGVWYQVVTPDTCKPLPEPPSNYHRLDNVSILLGNAIDEQDTAIIRDIVFYFIQSNDMDNDGQMGYGLVDAWDAFRDASVNPAYHEYTVTNALVLLELARALQLDIWSADEYDAISNTIYQVVQAVNDTTWDESGFYRYSHAPTDVDHVLNVNAIWIGTQQYILANTDIGTASERALWQERNTQGVMSLLYIMPRSPLTIYRTGHPILNDLDHQAVQSRHLEIYRDNGGWLPYSLEDAINTVNQFQHKGGWYIRPGHTQCVTYQWQWYEGYELTP